MFRAMLSPIIMTVFTVSGSISVNTAKFSWWWTKT